MSDVVWVAVITGAVTIANALLNHRSKKKDDLSVLRKDVATLNRAVDRIAAGLALGLKNDQVIFKAFRNNAINGESELQDRLMDEYFANCAADGFKIGKGE